MEYHQCFCQSAESKLRNTDAILFGGHALMMHQKIQVGHKWLSFKEDCFDPESTLKPTLKKV